MSIRRRVADFGRPIDFEALTVTTTSTPLTGAAGAVAALVTVDGAAVRWRSDGTDPTASVGMYLASGDKLEVGTAELGSIEFIAVSGTATVSVTYYGD